MNFKNFMLQNSTEQKLEHTPLRSEVNHEKIKVPWNGWLETLLKTMQSFTVQKQTFKKLVRFNFLEQRTGSFFIPASHRKWYWKWM